MAKKGPGKTTGSAASATKSKPKTTTKAKTKPTALQTQIRESDSEEELQVTESNGGTDFDIDWKRRPELTQRIIANIKEIAVIKNGLFPSRGPNVSTARGGGKKKAAHYFSLAKLVLGVEPEYKKAIEEAEKAKLAGERNFWGNKIKNRIATVKKDTSKHNKELGSTGEGIKDLANEVDMSQKNHFTNKLRAYLVVYHALWAHRNAEEILDQSPWYLDMRELIGERPNLVPTGIGHGSTVIDESVLGIEPSTDADSESQLMDDVDDDEEIKVEAGEEREEEEEGDDTARHADALTIDATLSFLHSSSPTPPPRVPKPKPVVDMTVQFHDDIEELPKPDPEVSRQEQKKGTNTNKKSNPPRRGTSHPAAPAAPTPAKPAKKAKLAEVTEMVLAEETTHQKEIELAKIRTQGQIEVERMKREEKLIKLRMKELEMKQLHELRLIKARGRHGVPNKYQYASPSMMDSASGSSPHASGSGSSLLDELGSLTLPPPEFKLGSDLEFMSDAQSQVSSSSDMSYIYPSTY
ncbi:unnamed protein product [Mycena citricolor]|uniref:No apical meristem-associated C-terminal domain-containing protein n=1 Tax=Mycena citricolor TaxID=2018698 RepID=A0AAD2GWH4_9AGAR|nr:unnamed protein product [Mycena citricolor]